MGGASLGAGLLQRRGFIATIRRAGLLHCRWSSPLPHHLIRRYHPPYLTTHHSPSPMAYHQVPPMPAEQARAVIERELGAPLEAVFEWIDLDEPLGSASISQVGGWVGGV